MHDGVEEQPLTAPRHQRSRLATAGLAALRSEHPSLKRHTLGGHILGSLEFWVAVEEGVPSGYQQQPPCPHASHRLTGNGRALSAPKGTLDNLITPHA